MDIAQKIIDFVPTENDEDMGQQAGRWLLANAFMGLSPDRDCPSLNEGIGSSAYLELGGYVYNPLHPGIKMQAHADLSIRIESRELVADPERTYWRPGNYECLVNWPSYGSSLPQVQRLRAQFIEAALQLAERFNAEFAEKIIWRRVSTSQQRDVDALANARLKTHTAVALAIKEAIHTTCRRMRVGDDRYVTRQDWWVKGTYPVVLESKEYDAVVFDHCLHFRRTK